MPEIVHPTLGFKEFVNLNKDSTHPNPWKPPNFTDQLTRTHSSAYKIYHSPWDNRIGVKDETKNKIANGPFSERLWLWGKRGFGAGNEEK